MKFRIEYISPSGQNKDEVKEFDNEFHRDNWTRYIERNGGEILTNEKVIKTLFVDNHIASISKNDMIMIMDAVFDNCTNYEYSDIRGMSQLKATCGDDVVALEYCANRIQFNVNRVYVYIEEIKLATIKRNLTYLKYGI